MYGANRLVAMRYCVNNHTKPSTEHRAGVLECDVRFPGWSPCESLKEGSGMPPLEFHIQSVDCSIHSVLRDCFSVAQDPEDAVAAEMEAVVPVYRLR